MTRMADKLASALAVTPICPRCKSLIPSEDVNVGNDIAFCRRCNLAHSLAALASGVAVDENVDFSRPPAGTWFQRNGDGMIVGATHRSLGQAFTLLFISLFWNGIVSVFLVLAAASTLGHLGISLPAWLPGGLAKPAHMPLLFTIFLWVFLTPFIAVGAVLASTFLSCLAGRTELRVQGREGVLFTGIGPLGFSKRFATSEVKDVRIEDRRWRDSDGDSRRSTQIIIDTGLKPIKFGSMLTKERRQFLAGVVKKELVRS